MATYSCIIFYFLFPQVFSPIAYDSIPNFIGIVFLTTFVIPAISILFLRYTNRISSLQMSQREERFLPFLSITAFYGITTYLFISKIHVSDQLAVMMVVVTILVGLILLISIRYKISVHSAGMWGTFGIFAAFAIKYLTTGSIIYLIIIVLLAGVVSFSRLYLDKHSNDEVWSGAILGFVLCFCGIYFFA
ncbi:MAG: PA-phosphatase [Bacteroidota bacterium]